VREVRREAGASGSNGVTKLELGNEENCRSIVISLSAGRSHDQEIDIRRHEEMPTRHR
jgi:hypothetical protein